MAKVTNMMIFAEARFARITNGFQGGLDGKDQKPAEIGNEAPWRHL
jgi:hypothetical protein